MKTPYIPNELLDIIFEYDGRIKYKNGEYVNIIRKNDERYNMIAPIISKKMKIMKNIQLSSHYGLGFVFIVYFTICKSVGLLYDYNFSNKNQFEICYYVWRNNDMKHMRTYL